MKAQKANTLGANKAEKLAWQPARSSARSTHRDPKKKKDQKTKNGKNTNKKQKSERKQNVRRFVAGLSWPER